MTVFPEAVSLTVSGSAFPVLSGTLYNSLCEPVDTLQIETSDLSAAYLRPYNPVIFTCFDLTYRGYVSNAEVSFPPGTVTLSISDELKKAEDYWELGIYAGNNLYVPIQANNEDVSYWFNYWCDRIGMNYIPATTVDAAVPPTVFWQNISGLDVMRQLTAFAGNGYQVKAEASGSVSLLSYNNVEETGPFPSSIETTRIVNDDWTRNEVIFYCGNGTVDLVNPASDIPPSFLKKKSIIDSPLLSDTAFAQDVAAQLLKFYSHFTDIWTLVSEDLSAVYEPGVSLGGKLLVTNNLHIDDQGILQHMIFDRFCPNMWGSGARSNFDKYYSTIVFRIDASGSLGLQPFIINPLYNYKVHGMFIHADNALSLGASLYTLGEQVENSSVMLVSLSNTTYSPCSGSVLLNANYPYQLDLQPISGSVSNAWIGIKYAVP